MKYLLISLLAVALFSGTAVQGQIATFDHADVNAFAIKKTSTGATIPLLASPEAVNRAFGAPSSSVPYYGEMDDITYTKSDYDGLTIYFDNGKTAYLDLAAPAYGLVLNKQVIRVGNNISTLSALFPDSYAARTNEQIFIELRANGEMIDMRIVISFNQSDEITGIFLAQGC